MITKTSLQALKQNKDKFLLKRIQILKALKTLQPCNNMMIHKKTGITLSCVCGRMNELRTKEKYKFVTFSNKGICPYTNTVTNFYTLTSKGEYILTNLNKQEDNKYGQSTNRQ